jgi:hypothetical protein
MWRVAPGKSTVALREIAEWIVGVDSSEEMLARAPQDDRIRYIKAPAENSSAVTLATLG